MTEFVAVCPFCGGDNLSIRNDGDKSFIYCNDCYATGPLTTPDEAVKKWNMTYARYTAKIKEIMGW